MHRAPSTPTHTEVAHKMGQRKAELVKVLSDAGVIIPSAESAHDVHGIMNEEQMLADTAPVKVVGLEPFFDVMKPYSMEEAQYPGARIVLVEGEGGKVYELYFKQGVPIYYRERQKGVRARVAGIIGLEPSNDVGPRADVEATDGMPSVAPIRWVLSFRRWAGELFGRLAG